MPSNTLQTRLQEVVRENRRLSEELEEVRRRSEEKFGRIFQSNPAGMLITRVADAQFTAVNESLCQIVGYSREEILGHTWVDLGFVPEAEREEVRHQFREQGNIHNHECKITAKNGMARWVLFSLDPIEFSGDPSLLTTVIDITQHKQAEENLAASEQQQREIARLLELDQARLAAVIQHLPVGVWIADQNGQLIGTNRQADLVWEHASRPLNSPVEYQTYIAWRPVNGKRLQPEEHPVAVALRTGQPVKPVELKVRHLDGSEGTALVSAAPIKDHHDVLIGAVGVNVDITERKQGEQSALKSQVEIELHHRLMGQREQERLLIARNIHDGPVQTLMAAGFELQMFKDRFDDPALQSELEHVEWVVENTVAELRAILTELRPPLLQEYGLSQAIRVHAESLNEKYPGLELTEDVANDEGRFSADTALSLFRVYQEALSNVVRHSGATQANVRFSFEKDMVVLAVEDNGAGMEIAPDLITQTAEGHYGLAGMKERVEALNGEFQLQSTPGKGTTVIVKVPVR